MKETWLPSGSSDPLSYTCTCPCTTSSTPEPGQVLLFYRYFASPPSLPPSLLTQAANPLDLAAFHTSLTQNLHLGGKIRIAREGFNITVGGTASSISQYIGECRNHWSFTGLDSELDTEAKGKAFFKPTPGCACVFSGCPASVRVCSEITPMGITDYAPKDWDVVESLSPADFHARCWEAGGRKVLVDVRNYYESRIGYFVDPITGRAAVRPGVRRFGQWPQFVKHNLSALQTQMDEEMERGLEKKGIEIRNQGGEGKGMQYLTYCTGGIRCEKGARYLAENLQSERGGSDKVFTLKGGIQAYLMWMEEEIKAKRKTADKSLFRGKNYVFDARGSTSLSGGREGLPVSQCHMCKEPEDRLSKCRSRACHLILVVCEGCEVEDVRCCFNCLELDGLPTDKESKGPRPICMCEKERELKLWGEKSTKSKKNQGRRAGRKSGVDSVISVQIKPIV